MWEIKNARSNKWIGKSHFLLNLGSVEIPIEEYVQLAKEEIVDAKYNMAELVDLAWDNPFGFRLNEEPIEGNDVDGQPTPIVKLPQVCEFAQLLSNYVINYPS